MLSHRTGAQVLRLGPTTQWHTAQRIFIQTGSKMHGTQPLRGCLQGCYGACRGGLMQHAGYELPRIPVLRSRVNREGFLYSSFVHVPQPLDWKPASVGAMVTMDGLLVPPLAIMAFIPPLKPLSL